MNPGLERRAGCLSGGLGAALVLLLAPLAYVVRVFRGWRRGSEILVEAVSAPPRVSGGAETATVDVSIDVPIRKDGEMRAVITDTVIRVAEKLRLPDDVYHQIYRQRGLDETTVLPVGPLLQELGERLSLALGHGPLAGRTVVWLTLPRSRAPAELVDPTDYDPEAEGEPQAVMEHPEIRWGFATSFAFKGPATIYRLLFFVPAESVRRIETLIDRLKQ